MDAPRPRARRDERGYAMVELLVGALLALIVVGAGVSVFTASLDAEPRATTRGSQIQQARAFADRVSRELRQGSTTTTATASQLALVTYVRRTACNSTTVGASRPCRVTYTCTAGTCTRTVANPDGSSAGAAVQVVSGLADSNVFTYAPSATAPSYVGVRLSFPAGAGEDSVTLEDGTELRNEGLG